MHSTRYVVVADYHKGNAGSIDVSLKHVVKSLFMNYDIDSVTVVYSNRCSSVRWIRPDDFGLPTVVKAEKPDDGFFNDITWAMKTLSSSSHERGRVVFVLTDNRWPGSLYPDRDTVVVLWRTPFRYATMSNSYHSLAQHPRILDGRKFASVSEVAEAAEAVLLSNKPSREPAGPEITAEASRRRGELAAFDAKDAIERLDKENKELAKRLTIAENSQASTKAHADAWYAELQETKAQLDECGRQLVQALRYRDIGVARKAENERLSAANEALVRDYHAANERLRVAQDQRDRAWRDAADMRTELDDTKVALRIAQGSVPRLVPFVVADASGSMTSYGVESIAGVCQYLVDSVAPEIDVLWFNHDCNDSPFRLRRGTKIDIKNPPPGFRPFLGGGTDIGKALRRAYDRANGQPALVVLATDGVNTGWAMERPPANIQLVIVPVRTWAQWMQSESEAYRSFVRTVQGAFQNVPNVTIVDDDTMHSGLISYSKLALAEAWIRTIVS